MLWYRHWAARESNMSSKRCSMQMGSNKVEDDLSNSEPTPGNSNREPPEDE